MLWLGWWAFSHIFWRGVCLCLPVNTQQLKSQARLLLVWEVSRQQAVYLLLSVTGMSWKTFLNEVFVAPCSRSSLIPLHQSYIHPGRKPLLRKPLLLRFTICQLAVKNSHKGRRGGGFNCVFICPSVGVLGKNQAFSLGLYFHECSILLSIIYFLHVLFLLRALKGVYIMDILNLLLCLSRISTWLLVNKRIDPVILNYIFLIIW